MQIATPQVGTLRNTLAVSGGVGVPEGQLIFAPGDPAGQRGNIFVDWPSLYAALNANAGEYQTLAFDDRFTGGVGCVIPAGVWNMWNVTWTNVAEAATSFIILADGAQIILEPDAGQPGNNLLHVYGYGLGIRSDRVGPVCPFDNTNGQFGGVMFGGGGVRFLSVTPGALPLFKAGPRGLFFITDGAGARHGFGRFGFNVTAPNPIVDAAGGIVFIGQWAGQISNNAFTTSVPGGVVQVTPHDDGVATDRFLGWSNPALIAGGGVLMIGGVTSHYTTQQQTRYRVQSINGVIQIVTANYNAAYDECVFCDTTGGPIVVTAPSALVAAGELLTVKDHSGSATANIITVQPRAGESVESNTIGNAFGSRTWVSDGLGHWNLIGSN